MLQLVYTVTVALTQLSSQLEIINTGSSEEKNNDFSFTTLLHSYFTVDDVAKLTITGLYDVPYVDKV